MYTMIQYNIGSLPRGFRVPLGWIQGRWLRLGISIRIWRSGVGLSGSISVAVTYVKYIRL